jgi:peptide/nickel transport system substrate-binding protein
MKELEFKLDISAKLARKGRVSRRDFVQLAMAAGFTAAAADTMFTTAARAEPKKGGHFRMGMGHGATTDSSTRHLPDQDDRHRGWGLDSNSLTGSTPRVASFPTCRELRAGRRCQTRVRRSGATSQRQDRHPADVIASFRHHGRDSEIGRQVLCRCHCRHQGGRRQGRLRFPAASRFPYIASDYHIPIMPAKDDGTVDWQSGIRTTPFLTNGSPAFAQPKRNPTITATRGSTRSPPPSLPMSRRAPTP